MTRHLADDMDSLADTQWDVLIAGTGLPQSLLALALSRSDKKVLHIDKNEYYGGPDAALTLQDAEEWVKQVNAENASPFKNASIKVAGGQSKISLGFSRSYSLALSPQIIYTRSSLLPTLVSSKVYRQLEFLAVGSWFVYEEQATGKGPSLHKIPNSREDVFADKDLDLKVKRSLISFLRSIREPDGLSRIVEEHGTKPLSHFLSDQYKLVPSLQSAVAALTLTPNPPAQTTVAYALPRIARHLASIGVFGPGFGAVIPKWGGLSELAQVACRAQAVGGGTYMLGKGVRSLAQGTEDGLILVTLDSETQVPARLVCGSRGDLPDGPNKADMAIEARSITIVAAGLVNLFAATSEGGVKATVAIVCFPPGTLGDGGARSSHPVYLMVHSSETGECPEGQCIIYASIAVEPTVGSTLLDLAIEKLLVIHDAPIENILWCLHYGRQRPEAGQCLEHMAKTASVCEMSGTSLDLSFNDEMLQEVRSVWQRVTGDTDSFMTFEDREVGAYDDEDEQRF